MNDKLNEPDFGDEELDALLKSVEVPNGLKEGLRRISEQSNELMPTRRDDAMLTSSRRRPFVIAVAASFALMAAILIGRSWTNQGDDDILNNSKPVAIGEPVEQELALGEGGDMSLSEQLQLELEIEILRSRLSAIKAKRPPIHISQRETSSIVAAIAGESHYLLGGSKSTSLAQSKDVMRDFPDTTGAELAKNYISSLTEIENETDL